MAKRENQRKLAKWPYSSIMSRSEFQDRVQSLIDHYGSDKLRQKIYDITGSLPAPRTLFNWTQGRRNPGQAYFDAINKLYIQLGEGAFGKTKYFPIDEWFWYNLREWHALQVKQANIFGIDQIDDDQLWQNAPNVLQKLKTHRVQWALDSANGSVQFASPLRPKRSAVSGGKGQLDYGYLLFRAFAFRQSEAPSHVWMNVDFFPTKVFLQTKTRTKPQLIEKATKIANTYKVPVYNGIVYFDDFVRGVWMP